MGNGNAFVREHLALLHYACKCAFVLALAYGLTLVVLMLATGNGYHQLGIAATPDKQSKRNYCNTGLLVGFFEPLYLMIA